MITVGVKELKDNLSSYLQKVEQGEIVQISRHGKVIAELCPVHGNRHQRLIAELQKKDIVIGGSGNIGSVKRVKNRKVEHPISDLVIEERR